MDVTICNLCNVVHPHPIQRQATHKVLHTTSCILQSNAPEDGHNYCPKHVELTFEC